MARKAADTPKGKTLLGQKIEQWLRGKGETGEVFQQKMRDAVPSYKPVPTKISKYVTTGRPLPTVDFISAVASVLKISEEEASELASLPAKPSRYRGSLPAVAGRNSPFNLLVGHTIWAAPIVLAAMEGRIPAFRVATYLNEKREPAYIDPTLWKEDVRQNRSAAAIGRPPVPGPHSPVPSRDSDTRPRLQCLSAVTATRLLDSSPNISAVAIPGRLAEERDSDLLRVGCIADTDVGGLLVCDALLDEKLENKAAPRLTEVDWNGVPGISYPHRGDRLKLFPAEISAEWLAHSLLTRSDGCEPPLTSAGPVVALELGAIGHRLLEAGCEVFFPGEGSELAASLMLPCTSAEMEHASYDDLRQRTKDRFPNKRELAGVVTWHPLARWLERTSGPTKLEIYGLTFPADSSPRHLTFDICMRMDDAVSTDKRNVELRTSLVRLIEDVTGYCDDLNLVASRSRPRKNIMPQLAKLSNYFALGDEEIDEELPDTGQLTHIRGALASVRFDAAIYASALKRYAME